MLFIKLIYKIVEIYWKIRAVVLLLKIITIIYTKIKIYDTINNGIDKLINFLQTKYVPINTKLGQSDLYTKINLSKN